ncbi:MAG: hypothetical protein P4L62_00290 [Candidatus Pacebacteria bacterium]|nr:hypothetical protein [Candidatus Paceibacterota bacterium]
MNKKVSSNLAIAIVLVVAMALGAYVWIQGNSVQSEDYPTANIAVAKNQNFSPCSAHTYQGEADVHVWQTQKDGDNIIEVAPADLAKLPTDKNTEFQLADITPDLQNKLTASSEKNPIEVTVTGFMTRCNNQAAVAALNYKDGVFKPFL